jgi:hypothetical protein
MGRKGDRAFLKQFSLVTAYADGDDVKKSEANTPGSVRGRSGNWPSYLYSFETLAVSG